MLQKTHRRLASLLDVADGQQLRRIASVIARAAVEDSGLVHPLITQALHQLSISTEPDSKLQARVEMVAEQLDEDYFIAKQPYEEREDAGKTEPVVRTAFARARAASAVAAALGNDARTAAAETAYEGMFATNHPEHITHAAESVIRK
jgi:thioredoxin-like negative regulator of GroEL